MGSEVPLSRVDVRVYSSAERARVATAKGNRSGRRFVAEPGGSGLSGHGCRRFVTEPGGSGLSGHGCRRFVAEPSGSEPSGRGRGRELLFLAINTVDGVDQLPHPSFLGRSFFVISNFPKCTGVVNSLRPRFK